MRPHVRLKDVFVGEVTTAVVASVDVGSQVHVHVHADVVAGGVHLREERWKGFSYLEPRFINTRCG